MAAAASEAAQLHLNVLAAPRNGGGVSYLQQSVASLLYGGQHLHIVHAGLT